MESAGEKNMSSKAIIGRSPLFFYTLSYLSGILYGNTLVLSAIIPLIISSTLLIGAFLVYYNAKNQRDIFFDFTLKILLITSIFFAGLFNISGSPHAHKNLKSSINSFADEVNLSLLIKEDIKVSRNSLRALCFCIGYNESILIYFPKDVSADYYEPGDTIFAKIRLREFGNSTRKEIEYKKYLKTKRVFFYAFLRSAQYEVVKPHKRTIYTKFNGSRKLFIDRLRERAGDAAWGDLLLAILIGEKSWLDPEIKNAFATSGAMHLMAVSGLHAGFIFIFIGFITSILGNRRFFKFIRVIMTLSVLWGYCAVAGFSHSSVRAVIMISMLLVNKIINRPAISLNSLCSSALIITVLSPASLYDIGFQLSYAALISIIFINPGIEKLFKTRVKILNWFWALISISISCQIGTALISIAKFGIFPLYFLLTNIIMLPLTASLIYLSSLSLLIHLITGKSELITEVIRFISELLIKTAFRIESLPYSQLELSLSSGARLVFISMTILTFIDVGLSKTRKNYIYAALLINLIIMYWQS